VRLASIHVYPMKAGRAVDLDESLVEPWGLAGDRRWLLVDEDGRFVSQREERSLARVVVCYPRPVMLFWHVPAPNEALLISGSKRRNEATQFRIVTGHGCFVVPVKQKARVLSLALREAEIVEECITSQGIRLKVRAVAAFKAGDDEASIANAARRFLSEQDRMEVLVGRVFAGHLRSIIGGLTVEQIIRAD
jgi:hypothetical protein